MAKWRMYSAALGAVLLGGVLVEQALSGVLAYTTQGDICRRLENKAKVGVPITSADNRLSICAARHGLVYRAFIVELVSGVVVFASAMYLLRRVKSRAK